MTRSGASLRLGRSHRKDGEVKNRDWGSRVEVIAMILGVAACLSGAASASAGVAGSRATTFTLYAKPLTVEFMNHADDRVRGMATNPFAAATAGLVIVAKGTEKSNGPFAGDDVLYTFNLYSTPALSKPTGTATFTCYFEFAKKATCEAYFKLANGLLLASGQVPFDGTRFSMQTEGGTSAFVGRRGAITAVSGGPNDVKAQRLDVTLTGTTGGSAAGKNLTLFSSATAVQYLNNADDEARGLTNNPFAGAVNKLRPKLTWKGNGPFAGDVVIYSFDLFRDSARKVHDGTAVYTCYFNYAHVAFCDAFYSVKSTGGTILASGPIDFNTTGFDLPVTGGTKGYIGASGSLKESATTTQNTQRIDFRLSG
jgi:hypothetical protein